MTREEIAAEILDACDVGGAEYADVRLVDRQREFYRVSGGRASSPYQEQLSGFGVRVLVDGAWGFAAGTELSKVHLQAVSKRAIAVGKASALVQTERVNLGAPVVHQGQYHTPIDIDPFSIPASQKMDVLLAADQAMRSVDAVANCSAEMEFVRREKLFASSEGSLITQTIVESGAGLSAMAVRDGEMQSRTFPTNLARQQGTGGYEIIEDLALEKNAAVVAQDAAKLLDAIPCPEGEIDVIMDATLLAHLLHEIVGHNTELDRIYGAEIAYAGSSFVTPGMLHQFQYASPVVNVYLDSTYPQGLGTFGFDDEGVPAQKADLIKEGTLVGFHTSRETASRLGQMSNGCMRADGFNRFPIIRMTNIMLAPGEWDLDELIADTQNGLLLGVNKSWSISERRDRVLYGAEYGYEIKDGRLGRLVKNPSFRANTVDFWRSCDAVCDASSFRVFGLPFCGKGEPWQGGPISHGCSPARFRKVRMG